MKNKLINESIKMHHGFHKNGLPEQFSALVIIINVSWGPNQHIQMISKGSCDTEEWSNGCWIFSFAITRILLFEIYSKRKKFDNQFISSVNKWLLKECVWVLWTQFLTLGDAILTYTRIGAKAVLLSWRGWLIVSASRTTSCRLRANSKILSTSPWIWAVGAD